MDQGGYDLLEGDGRYSGSLSATVKCSIVSFVLSPLCLGALTFCDEDFFDRDTGCPSVRLEVG